jgi:hypothetical protein
MLRIAVEKVSQGSQGPDVAQVHCALAELSKTVAANERAMRVYGPTTTEAVRALQSEFGISVTGVVDEASVNVINKRLGTRTADERVVRGSVRLATGAPAAAGGLVARVWHQDRERQHLLGERPLDQEGVFEVRYRLSGEVQKRNRVDLRVEIATQAGTDPLATRPDGRSILQDADLLEVVDFVIVQPDRQPQSEYDQISADVEELLGELGRLDRMDGEQLHLLAEEASYPVGHLAALVTARRFAHETQLPEPTFYALVREGLPADLAGLLSTSPSVLRAAIDTAVKDKIVRETLDDGRLIGDALKDLRRGAALLASVPPHPDASSLLDLARLVLTDAEHDDLLGKYAAAGDADAFWSSIESHPKAKAFRHVVDLGGLTHNHVSLVQAITALQLDGVSDLATLPIQEWDRLLAQSGTPTDTPGGTGAEKAANFRTAVLGRVESAFFRPFFATRLQEAGAPAPLVQFLKAQDDFDPKRTHIEGFLKTHPGAILSDGAKEELKAYQRILKVTGSAADAIAVKPHAASAQKIVAMGRKSFTEKVPTLTEARAREIFERAVQTNAAALALWSEHAGVLNRTGMAALPRLDPEILLSTAVGDDQQPGPIPDWETLFGSFDLCACDHCNSVYGPAAYFVDLLQFLESREVLDRLIVRRPDLVDIELSCENTNTVLPYVDLVNEILEDQVVRPEPFVEQVLTGVSLVDFAGPLATEQLRSAFVPPLQAAASVEVLEAGTSWRVLDEQFAHQVNQEAGVFKVVTRSRQTTGSTAERRAYPQYRNARAYETLNSVFYPWTLPFDRDSEEASIFLQHLGVSRRDLIGALVVPAGPLETGSPLSVRLASERLGLTDQERRVLVGELAVDRADFWGDRATATVQDVLDGSGLLFDDLDRTLATWFVNPDGNVRIEPTDSCDTTALTIEGLSDSVLSRLHRFVRLWRKLGWSIEEFDKVLRTLSAAPASPTLNNEVLVRVAHVMEIRQALKAPVLEVLAFWSDVDTVGPKSLYRSLFQDEKFPKAVRESFRLRPDGQELNDATQSLVDNSVPLQAVLRLSGPHLSQLIALTDGYLNLANLSFLLRRARLAQGLKLSPDDLFTATALTGLDPFESSEATLRFVTAATAVRSSGLRWAELDYLLRHRFQPPAPFVPPSESLAATLTELRAGLLQLGPDVDDIERHALVLDRITGALRVPEGLTRALLADQPRMATFLAIQDVPLDTPLTRTNAAPQFDLLQKTLKIAQVVNRLALPGAQWERLLSPGAWVDLELLPMAQVDVSPLAFDVWFRLVQFVQLRRDLDVVEGALEAALLAQQAVAVADDGTDRKSAKTAFISTLSQWLGWDPSDVGFLIGEGNDPTDFGLLRARLPEDYQSPELLIRLNHAIRVLKSLGATAQEASTWCEDTVGTEAARGIRSAAMARHDEQAWLSIARPLHDPLRNAQRSSLVNYLVARPELWQPAGVTGRVDARDLFAHHLIDVEMDACQLTSRIKHATGSIQLFAQRCLMGLEGVTVDDEKWLQWRWMKNFRVWEANRKVWLYPENWIEPELRDNKTPFFKELEAELLQGEITDAAAEEAVLHYLEKLDQIGRLEICGVYQDDDTRLLHVFGRTINAPRIYFYRRARVIDTTSQRFSDWTPWEMVQLPIEGDHLIPVVRNRKLTLLWPEFNEKQLPKQVSMPEPGEVLRAGDPYWDIQMAWSEYQGGQWSAKNVSQPVKLRAYQGIDDVLFDTRVAPIEENGFVTFRHINPGNEPSGNPVPLTLVDKSLFSFKALVSGDSVTVRGYLSLGYAAAKDEEVSAAFGEFHLSGCRNIVTSRPRTSIQTRTLPLAPKGTRFDYMWFEHAAGALRLLDGPLPVHHDVLGATRFSGNVSSPLFDGLPTVASMKANKIDIEVFRSTPSPFRLLAPHQDLQFKGDRPFFFMDHQHTLLVTSTGSSGQRVRPDHGEWTAGDLGAVWTADYFGVPEPVLPVTPQLEPRSFVILKRGADGTRQPSRVIAPDVLPQTLATRLIPQFWTTRRYQFVPFEHPFTCEFLTTLDKEQLRGLLSLSTQERVHPFFDRYGPIEERVQEADAPVDEVDFRFDGTYEIYNWELFFHVPLLIADRLTKNQRFEEAMRWYHFIFDPTASAGGEAPGRYWRTLPFNRRLQNGAGTESYEAQAVLNIEKALAHSLPNDWLSAVDVWRANPFNPHAVARLRTTAYQKAVVMKYIDNLVAWGDQLFRRETLESLNEATQLYVLAAEVLGRRPEVIARRHGRRLETFKSLSADSRLGPLSNAEQLVPDPGPPGSESRADVPEPPSELSLYFCVPENDMLLGYWNTVADRLFKLRHCMDIEGRVRQLPLFEPPIDPALLVRAEAAGLTISEVLNAGAADLSNYRFAVMLQKANELTSETRSLASALVSALEKRDAEALALLRTRQETTLLTAVRDNRQKQIAEAREQVVALQESRRLIEARKQFYESREFQNAHESKSLELAASSQALSATSASFRHLAGRLAAIGALKIGAPSTSGLEVGPDYMARSLEADAGAFDALANRKSAESQRASRLGDFTRRKDDWDLQLDLATIELVQIDRQLAAADIRLAIAERELQNHDLQIEQNREADQFMHEKFTNVDLFGWMVGQISALYFQTYQLAFDLARRAERCLQFELGEQDGQGSYIRFGYWDSLKKGLMAGDRLAHDLRRLELAHLEKNVREYELTKHVSLVTLDPLAFIALKENGKCDGIRVPEALFDLETPGHYLRCLKTVGVTIPCVTGPYTGVHCKVLLTSNEIRWDKTAPVDADGYARMEPDDLRFIVDRRVVQAIVTSTGQTDSGLFEANLHDERYLPFEGAGAVSTWSLELPADFRSFDYNTISDVILHLRYTARDGGDALKEKAVAATRQLVGRGLLRDGATPSDQRPLERFISLRHEFPSEWHRLTSNSGAASSVTLDVAAERFPYFVQGKEIAINKATASARTKTGDSIQLALAPGQTAPAPSSNPWEGQAIPGLWTVSVSAPSEIEDLFLILEYGAS